MGIHLDANAAFVSGSQGLQITGSGGRPIHTTMMSLGSLPGGTYTGNATDEILIHGPGANVFANMTVADLGVPIRIPFGNMYIGPAPPAVAPVTSARMSMPPLWQTLPSAACGFRAPLRWSDHAGVVELADTQDLGSCALVA